MVSSRIRELLQGELIVLQNDALPHVKIRDWTFLEIDENGAILLNHKEKGYVLEVRRRISIGRSTRRTRRSIRKTRNEIGFFSYSLYHPLLVVFLFFFGDLPKGCLTHPDNVLNINCGQGSETLLWSS